MIHEITEKIGKYKARKRIGRGRGSGTGKTSGRGHKGAGSRSGYSRRPSFEGGQTPYFRRIPKRGFSNAAFRTEFHIVNVAALQDRFEAGANVDAAATNVDATAIAAASASVKSQNSSYSPGRIDAASNATTEATGATAESWGEC